MHLVPEKDAADRQLVGKNSNSFGLYQKIRREMNIYFHLK